MDPALLPWVQRMVQLGPLERLEVVHRAKPEGGGRDVESVVATVATKGLSPEDLSAAVWDEIGYDAEQHDGPVRYWVVAWKHGQTRHVGRIGFRCNQDKLGKVEDDRILRGFDLNERALTNREKYIGTLEGKVVDVVGLALMSMGDMLKDIRADLRATKDRELETIRLHADLLDRKHERELALMRMRRDERLYEKFSNLALTVMGEAMGEGGKLHPAVTDQLLQDFVDGLTDEQVRDLIGRGQIEVTDDQKLALFRMLQPYMQRAKEKAAENNLLAAAGAVNGVSATVPEPGKGLPS